MRLHFGHSEQGAQANELRRCVRRAPSISEGHLQRDTKAPVHQQAAAAREKLLPKSHRSAVSCLVTWSAVTGESLRPKRVHALARAHHMQAACADGTYNPALARITMVAEPLSLIDAALLDTVLTQALHAVLDARPAEPLKYFAVSAALGIAGPTSDVASSLAGVQASLGIAPSQQSYLPPASELEYAALHAPDFEALLGRAFAAAGSQPSPSVLARCLLALAGVDLEVCVAPLLPSSPTSRIRSK